MNFKMKYLAINSLLIVNAFCAHTGEVKASVSGKNNTLSSIAKKSQKKENREAFINVPLVFNRSAQGKKIQEEMVAEAQRIQGEFNQANQALEKAKADYAKKSSVMSDEARRKEEKRVDQLARDLSIKMKEEQEEFEAVGASKQNAWAQEFQESLREWAQQEMFDVVWDEVSGQCLFAADELKHTEEVIAFLDNKKTKVIKDGQVQGKESRAVAGKESTIKS